ncbi:MAG: putative baseplate assembly protein [Chloroflexi bacterium]|nr:MAG: putative baseplate assembly protein [Chloroflexota bacterium]PIE79679.1 MAG: putative baseplate assembly protein [Chloroflexota bacterium]
MALAVPKLDDRSFQQLVDEAKKRIPHYVQEWTDHNVSDPGVTLIELFAWMTETMLYRMNRVPDLHYVKFMEIFGITLKPPVPAKVPVTFWLSAPKETDLIIPHGTEVASTQTETQPAILFTTNEAFTVRPPELTAVLSELAPSRGKPKRFTDLQNLRRLSAGFDGFEVFSSTPLVDDALYFGFNTDLSHHILRFDMEWDAAGGAGIDPTLPPIVWESATNDNEKRWIPCDVELDTTKGMNDNGRFQIHLPGMGKLKIKNNNLYWVRVRVKEISNAEKQDGMRPYQVSPQLRKLECSTWGGTVPATHTQTMVNEFLGQSDGSTGQRYLLQATPILARREEEQLIVQIEGEGNQTWTEVKDFGDSDADSHHYTLDSVTGELRFGPAVRQPDGTIKLYGAVPPRGSNLIFPQYRCGGGDEGNVETGVINTLVTSIPYVSRISNREPAWGGLDAETLEDAMVRTPKLLRHRERAVTASDFEDLALETPGVTIGRVKCLQPLPSEAGRVTPGQVYMLVIPRVRYPAGYLEPNSLEPPDADIERLTRYLDERRLLTTRLHIRAPAYYWVAARVQLRASIDAEQATVEAEVLNRLYKFLNPLIGGSAGTGWPFGRELFLSDVYQCLRGLPNVQFIRNVELYAAEPGGGPQGDPKESIDMVAHGVIASGLHEVEFV